MRIVDFRQHSARKISMVMIAPIKKWKNRNGCRAADNSDSKINFIRNELKMMHDHKMVDGGRDW
ncbi:MAG: hypothetical protein ACON35_04865 [Candidatus Marinamargulisbacteria bacterium]